MSFFELKNVTFKASNRDFVKNVSFKIEDQGEIICLLGPSGVGKTTMLRTISGLEPVFKGKIILNNKLISSTSYNLEPEKRNITLSFQENCLFPNLTIADNIKFGLKTKKINNDLGIDFEKIIKILQLNDFLNKYPHEISAGEAQRVSLARSIIIKPDLLLLDEPFSNIDQNLKNVLHRQIKYFLKKMKITTIIVTHDTNEAFYLADKCGIIFNQSLLQFDKPYNIYHYPSSKEVVKFLGRGSLISVKVYKKNKLKQDILGVINGKFIKDYKIGSSIKLLVQPDDLEHDDKSKLKLKVEDKIFKGTHFIYILKINENEFLPVFVKSHHRHQHKIGDEFGIKTPISIKHLVCF